MNYIILLVEDADVPAIYPEREYKTAHTPGYQDKVWVHGHKIRDTYLKAAALANTVLLGNWQAGSEAPDKDDDTGVQPLSRTRAGRSGRGRRSGRG